MLAVSATTTKKKIQKPIFKVRMSYQINTAEVKHSSKEMFNFPSENIYTLTNFQLISSNKLLHLTSERTA